MSPPANDNRRIYAIPVRLHVECTLFVIAADVPSAKRTAQTINLQDYFGFNDHSVTTDGAALLRINDVITFPLDPSTIDLTELTHEEYPPNTHPDFLNIPER